MIRAQLISYERFSKLRLQDFYTPGEQLFSRDRACECALGYSGYEAGVGVYFAWPQDRPNEVGEIYLDIGQDEKRDCQPEIAARILVAIGLPLEEGMKQDQIFDVLGRPRESRTWPTGISSFDFSCIGEKKSKYEVCCYVHPAQGFCGIQIVRADLLEQYH